MDEQKEAMTDADWRDELALRLAVAFFPLDDEVKVDTKAAYIFRIADTMLAQRQARRVKERPPGNNADWRDELALRLAVEHNFECLRRGAWERVHLSCQDILGEWRLVQGGQLKKEAEK